MRLSILIPVYNQAHSIRPLLERIISVKGEQSRELVVVDDGSSDQSAAAVKAFAKEHPEILVRLIEQPVTLGKGNAIRTAIEHANSEFCLLHDDGLDYDPADYRKLLKPLLAEKADVVLGSRFMGGSQRRAPGFRQAVVNRVINVLTGMASGVSFSDVETGLKAFRTSLAQSVPLHRERDGIEPELLIQFAKRHARFLEVPVSYKGCANGSPHLFSALAAILRARFSPSHIDPAADMLVAMSRAKRFNRWMADAIAPWVAGDVLELGAGIGNLTLPLARSASSYTATDSEAEHLYELNARVETLPNVKLAMCNFADWRDMSEYRLSADTVICLNALEHVDDDVDGLLNIRESLRPGGVAIILVPQGPEAFGSMDEVLEHKRRYTKGELRDKMLAAGFEVQRILMFNRATWPGWYLNSRLLRRRTLSPSQLWLFDFLVPLWRRIDGRLPWPATSLIAIGVAGE